MSSEKNPTKASKNDHQRSKTGSPRPPEPSLKCPRCDSPNTKFCYYNNYNLSQPRHFCKTCRRYWTKGGALRNVPVGGGCRKNKKMKPGSRLSDDSKDSGGSFDSTGFKFFHGVSPSMESFQYGTRLPFSRLNNSPSSSSNNNVYNHLFSFGDLSSTSNALTSTSSGLGGGAFDMDGAPSSTSLMGFSLPVRQGDHHQSGAGAGYNNNNWGVQDNLSMNVHSNLASSIESLSSINQDLHWKLQQQRLAMLYVEENQKESSVQGGGGILENQMGHQQNPKPISFQNLEISNPELMKSVGANNTTEWLFENSYNPATSSNSNGNDGLNNWNGVQVWGDMHRYSGLPQ
ncbi:hypothetical protein ACHQM5_024136 [Ranunculus cassubicifolius]